MNIDKIASNKSLWVDGLFGQHSNIICVTSAEYLYKIILRWCLPWKHLLNSVIAVKLTRWLNVCVCMGRFTVVDSSRRLLSIFLNWGLTMAWCYFGMQATLPFPACSWPLKVGSTLGVDCLPSSWAVTWLLQSWNHTVLGNQKEEHILFSKDEKLDMQDCPTFCTFSLSLYIIISFMEPVVVTPLLLTLVCVQKVKRGPWQAKPQPWHITMSAFHIFYVNI